MEQTNETQELVAHLNDIIENTQEFTIEQAPSVAREILTYGTVSHSIGFGIGFLMCIAIICVWINAWKSIVNSCSSRDDKFMGITFTSVIALGALFFPAMFTIMNLDSLIMVYFAPKMYLLDYVSNLLN